MYTFLVYRDAKRRAAAEKADERRVNQGLPSDEVILATVFKARDEAENIALSLGMNPELDECIPCPREWLRTQAAFEEVPEIPAATPVTVTPPARTSATAATATAAAATGPGAVAGTGTLSDEGLSSKRLCWLYSSKRFLSADRQIRARGTQDRGGAPAAAVCGLRRDVNVAKGDWCAFNIGGQLRIGWVLGFQYLSETGRHAKYSLPTAPVTVPDGVKARGLGCLCTLYSIEETGRLKREPPRDYFPIESYVLTVPERLNINQVLFCDLDLMEFLNLIPKNDNRRCALYREKCSFAYRLCDDCGDRCHLTCLGVRDYYTGTPFKCMDCTPLSLL